jgi:hypothetical protein
MSVLLSLASTRILLNGNPGERICYARGLRQGDPLSHMLFLLLMEVLIALICKADAWLLFHSLGVHSIAYRASYYVDDLMWIVTPAQQDIQIAHTILSIFERSSSLGCNLSKCQLAPIWCTEE